MKHAKFPFFNFHFPILALALLFAACEKEEKPDNGDETDVTSGATKVLILDEGSWGANNAALSALDPKHREMTIDWFSSVNGRGLGDVAQDLLLYGSKVYATVTFSNSLEVIDPKSGNATHVDMGSRNPR